MLKGLAILAVLLVVGQASTPSPRVTTDPKGGSIAEKQSGTQADKQPPRPGHIVSEQPTRNGGNNANAPKDGKDGWDKAAVLSNYLLVIVGIFGIIYAALTFGKLTKQTIAAEVAARAASKQTSHMIASERAWLVVSSVTKSESIIRPGFAPYYWWRIKNLGSTPARLIETAAVCIVNTSQNFPEEPFFRGRPIELHERILAPGDSLDFWSFWENGDGAVFRERVETLDWVCLRAYGYIKYKTIFGPEICEARFCDYFNHTPDNPVADNSVQYLIDFRSDLTAPAAYTKHT
jgi:hypothetical protein